MESQSQLLNKHRDMSIIVGSQALKSCLERSDLGVLDIDYLCVVTTTDFSVPGLSALLVKHLGLQRCVSRVDIFSMGCNAGLNGLNVVSALASANPGKVAVLLCMEICSAAYVYDGRMQTAVVNSLFGDGAAAVALRASSQLVAHSPIVRDFASSVTPEAVDAIRFDWDDYHAKFSFSSTPDVPYVVGANAEELVDRLQNMHRLRRSDIAHLNHPVAKRSSIQ
jgi:3,5-dihydroxyphenylacetyl-CoA synthase